MTSSIASRMGIIESATSLKAEQIILTKFMALLQKPTSFQHLGPTCTSTLYSIRQPVRQATLVSDTNNKRKPQT